VSYLYRLNFPILSILPDLLGQGQGQAGQTEQGKSISSKSLRMTSSYE